MDLRRAVTLGGCLGALLGGFASAAARAAILTPLDPAVPVRVNQLVPLGADGAQIALNAEDPQLGRQVSPGSYLVRDDIYLAGADGSGLRAAWTGPWGSANRALTATADGTLAAWINTMTADDNGAPLLISTLTGKTMHVRSTIGHPTYAVTGFIAGTSSLYATTDTGDVWRIAADGRLGPVTSTGSGVRRRVRQTVVSSRSGARLGACAAIIRRGRQDGMRLGVFDPDAGAWRYAVLAPGSSSTTLSKYAQTVTCAVSDGSGTVATLARRGGRILLAALFAGQPRIVRVPAFAQIVGAVSPTGRYVLIGSGGPFVPMSTGIRPALALGSRLAVVDLQSGRVAVVHGLHRHPGSHKETSYGFFDGADAVFSPDETHLGVGRPQTAGAFVIDTRTGAAAYVPLPPAPVGFQFAYGAMRPIGFSSDGARFAFAVYDKSEDLTLLHPYSVSIAGGQASYMLSDSDDSFQSVVSSVDGARTWIVSSSTCHSAPRYGALSLTAGGLWDTPFTVPASPLSL